MLISELIAILKSAMDDLGDKEVLISGDGGWEKFDWNRYQGLWNGEGVRRIGMYYDPRGPVIQS